MLPWPTPFATRILAWRRWSSRSSRTSATRGAKARETAAWLDAELQRQPEWPATVSPSQTSPRFARWSSPPHALQARKKKAFNALQAWAHRVPHGQRTV